MQSEYGPRQHDRRQRAGQDWPTWWTPEGLPDWYMGLLAGLASDLTAWRGDRGPRQQLDPRCDPRCPVQAIGERGHHANGQ